MKWANILNKVLAKLASVFPFLSRVINIADPTSYGRFASLISLLFVLLINTVYVIVGVIGFFHHRLELRDILPSPGALMSEMGFALAFYTASKGLDVVKNYGSQNSDKQ